MEVYIKAHSGVVELFVFFILVKVVLLFINKPLLGKIRAKTKIVDMVLGLATIVTGVLLLNKLAWNLPLWLALKIILAISSIPLGIIAFKKEKKPLAVITIVLMLAAYTIGKMKGAF